MSVMYENWVGSGYSAATLIAYTWKPMILNPNPILVHNVTVYNR